MSRLYEALRRVGKDADEMSGVTWKAFETDASAAATPKAQAPEPPPAMPSPAPVLPPADFDLPPLSAGASTSPVEPESVETFAAVETPEPVGTPVHTVASTVDSHLRLLPYATDPTVVEAYRRLRTKILQRKEELGFGSLMIASGNPREGKTLTTLNLALSFGMLPSFRVLVVDGDVRKGTIGEWLGIDTNLPGLSNLIDGSATVDDVLLRSDEIPMQVVLPGNSPIAPAELLNSPRLKEAFAVMASRFDLVLVDSPPVHLVTDAHLLAAACDAVLLVARGYKTSRKLFEKAAQEVGGSRVIGAVLNGGPTHVARYGYYKRGGK